MELSKARGAQNDLYLLDSWLPNGSGVDLCKRLREFDHATPILFYSAAAYEVDKELAIDSGAQGYLTNPSRTSELCDLIAHLIGAGRAANVGSHLGLSRRLNQLTPGSSIRATSERGAGQIFHISIPNPKRIAAVARVMTIQNFQYALKVDCQPA